MVVYWKVNSPHLHHVEKAKSRSCRLAGSVLRKDGQTHGGEHSDIKSQEPTTSPGIKSCQMGLVFFSHPASTHAEDVLNAE